MFIIGHNLDAEFPLRKFAALDGLVQILGGVIVVLALNLLGFRLGQITHAQLGNPVILDQYALAVLVVPLVGIYARTLHLAVVGRNSPRAEQPRDHMGGFWS